MHALPIAATLRRLLQKGVAVAQSVIDAPRPASTRFADALTAETQVRPHGAPPALVWDGLVGLPKPCMQLLHYLIGSMWQL